MVASYITLTLKGPSGPFSFSTLHVSGRSMKQSFNILESRRGWGIVVAVLGLLMVIFGAAGAHLFADASQANASRFETALEYHQIHTIAMAAWLWTKPQLDRLEVWVLVAWTTGLILFSGGLYGLALFDDHPFRSLTPVGGISLMLGWILTGLSLWRSHDHV